MCQLAPISPAPTVRFCTVYAIFSRPRIYPVGVNSARASDKRVRPPAHRRITIMAGISSDLRGRFARERCAPGTCVLSTCARSLTISPAITKQPGDACPAATSIDQLSVSDAIYAIASPRHESDDYYCCRLPRRVGTFDSLPRSCPRPPSALRGRRRIRGRGTCDRGRSLRRRRSSGGGRRADGSSSRIRGSGLAKRRVYPPFRRLLLIELAAMRR